MAAAPLGRIVICTVTAPDLDRTVEAYERWFGLKRAHETTVSAAEAGLWGAPATVGARMVYLQSAGGGASYLRFVEGPHVPGYAPMMSHGWASFEIICKDIYELAEAIKDGPFDIVGPPAVLQFDFTDKISAFQAIGAAGEMVYMTHVEEEVPGFDLPMTEEKVDRTFVAILGGPDLPAMTSFYETKFGRPASPPFTTRVTVLSRPHGLDPDTKHTLSTVALADQCLIEIDQFPPTATQRPGTPGYLPPGNAMVGFAIQSLEGLEVPFLSPPVVLDDPIHGGARVAVTTGAAGELIELIETA